MKRLRKILLLAMLALALAPALAACASGATLDSPGGTSAPLPAPGRTAPPISLTNLQGQQVTLAGLRGHPVLVNFWASWCGPCRSEMGYLQTVGENAAFQQAGFTLLEVNIQESPATVQKFLSDNGLHFANLLLDTEAVAAESYNVNGIPASFFIDKNGIIQKVKIGAYANLTSLERDVQTLIGSQ